MSHEMPPNEWSDYDLEGPETYSPARYYYRQASDTHGHSVVENFRLNPNHVGQVNKAVGDELTPYKTRADFYRDAIVHRLQWLSQNVAGAELAPELNAEMAAMRALQKRDTAAAYRRVVSVFGEGMEEAQRNREWELLADHVEEARVLAPSLPAPYDEELDELVMRFRRRAAER